MFEKCITRKLYGEYYTYHLFCLVLKFCKALKQNSICCNGLFCPTFEKKVYHSEKFPGSVSIAYILCTISFAISYVSHLFCVHLCAVPINFNCNDENRILGK